MGNPEQETPYDELDDSVVQDEPASESAPADFSDIDRSEESGAKIIDIDTRREIFKPVEVSDQPEHGKELLDAIALLKSDIQDLDTQVANRSLFLSEIAQWKNRKEMVKRQLKLNKDLVNKAARINRLERELKMVGEQKTFWRKKLLHPEKYDEIEREIRKIHEEKIAIWRERRDSDGNTIDISKLHQENRDIEAKLKKKANDNNEYFVENWELKMLAENRQAQKEILEKKQQIEDLEKQLAILEAFKS